MPTSISASEAQRLMEQGALMIDIRDPDEFARCRIAGAVNMPVGTMDHVACAGRSVLFHCRSGARTQGNAARLVAAVGDAPCYILEDGLDGWARAGLPVVEDKTQPLEIMRQVQLVAGGLIVLGVALGFLAAPAFFTIPAFVGVGLMTAGATGWCGMARFLRIMPWNHMPTPK